MELDTCAAREILVVVSIALLGVLLALVSVLAPWYAGPLDTRRPVVVEMHAPQQPTLTPDLGAARPR
ncbi:hypothetical protein ACN27F_12295 [Solwaraspora sp. WMMB335]|uniref:hypothetical protein n=1 Tax=Solwaraspora sp. WMMB335 TaxID=3404118 RepID=UPI003B928CD2